MEVSPLGNDLRKHIMKRIVLKNYYAPSSEPSSAEITSRQYDQEIQPNKQLEMDIVLERLNREYKANNSEKEQVNTNKATISAARSIRHSSSMQVIPSKQQEQSTSLLQRMHSTRLIDDSQQDQLSQEEIQKPLGSSIKNRMIQLFRKAIPNGKQEQQEDKQYKQIKTIIQKEDKSEEDIDLLMRTFAGGRNSNSYLTIIENQYGRPTLRKVLKVLSYVSFPQKKVIIRKNEPADKIYILLGGSAYKIKENQDKNRNGSVSQITPMIPVKKNSSGSSIGDSLVNQKKKEILLQGQENTTKIDTIITTINSERVLDYQASERIVVLPKSETTVGIVGSQHQNSNRRFSVMQQSEIKKQRQEQQQQPQICLVGVDADGKQNTSPLKRLSPSKSAQFFSDIDSNNLPQKVPNDCLKIEGIDQIDDSSESCNQSSVSSRQMSAQKIKSGFFQRLQQSPSAMSPLSIFNTPINRLNPKSNLTQINKNISISSDGTPGNKDGNTEKNSNKIAVVDGDQENNNNNSNNNTREYLSRGEIFGQLQSTINQRTVYYSDTVITDRRCEFAVLTMESYKAVISVLNEHEEKHDKIIDFLRTLQVFQSFNKQQLRQLSFAVAEQSIAKNAYLFKENTPADHLFIAQNGEFVIMRECSFDLSKVQNLDPNRIVKVKENLQICSSFPGEFFGEECVLDGQNAKRVFSVKCTGLDSSVLKISKQDLEAFYMSFEGIGISTTEQTEDLKSKQLKFSKPTGMEELVEGLQQKRKWRLERFKEMKNKLLKEKKITEDETLSSMINSHFYQKRREGGRNSPNKAISMLVQSSSGIGGTTGGGSGGDSPNQMKLRAAHNQYQAKTASFTSAFGAGLFGRHRGSQDNQNDKRQASNDSEDSDDNEELENEHGKLKQKYGEKAKTSSSSGSPGIIMLQSLNSNKKKKKTISDESSNNNTPRSNKQQNTRVSEIVRTTMSPHYGQQQQQQQYQEQLQLFNKKQDNNNINNNSSENTISKFNQNLFQDGRSPSTNGKNQLTEESKSQFETKRVAESDFSRECARIENAQEYKDIVVKGQLRQTQELLNKQLNQQERDNNQLKKQQSFKDQNSNQQQLQVQQQQQQYFLPTQFSQQHHINNINKSSSGYFNQNSTGDYQHSDQEQRLLPGSHGFRLENKVKLNLTSNPTKPRQSHGIQNHQIHTDYDHRDPAAEADEKALKEYYELKNLPISLIFAKSQQQSSTISSDLQHIHEQLKRIGIHTPSNINSPQAQTVSSQDKQLVQQSQQQGLHSNKINAITNGTIVKSKVGQILQQQQQSLGSSKPQGLMSNTPKKRIILDQKQFLKSLRDKNQNNNQNNNKSPFSVENLSSNRSSDGNEYIDIEDKLSMQQTDTVKLHRQISMVQQQQQQQQQHSYFKQRSLLLGSQSPTGTIMTTSTNEEAQQHSLAQEKQFLDAMNACAAKYQLVEMNYLESHSAKARKLIAESTQKSKMNLIQKFGEQTAQLHRQQSLLSKKRVYADFFIEKEKKAQQKRDGQIHKQEIDIEDRQSVITHLYQLQQSNAQIFQQKSDPTGCNASTFNFQGMKQRRKFGIVFMKKNEEEEIQQQELVEEEDGTDRYNEQDSLISQNEKPQNEQRLMSASAKSLAILAKLQQQEKEKVNRLQFNSSKRQAALEELKRKCQHNVFMRETLKKQEMINKAKGKIDEENDDKLKEFLIPQQTLRENHPQTAHSSTRNQVIWKRGISRKQNSEYLRQLVMNETTSQSNIDLQQQQRRLQYGGHYLRESYSFKNNTSSSQVLKQSQTNHTNTGQFSRNYQDSFNECSSSGCSDITKPYQHINLQRISSTSLYNSQWDQSKKQLVFNRMKTYNP